VIKKLLIIIAFSCTSYCSQAQKDTIRRNDTSAVKQYHNNRNKPKENMSRKDSIAPSDKMSRRNNNKGDSIPLP
jgi:hypothetical protein